MQSLVINRNSKLVTSLQKVASVTSSNVVSLQRLIRSHKTDLEKFGTLEYDEQKVTAGAGYTKKKLYYLNEQQSYLFITFLKNTQVVKQFKIALIDEFFKMKYSQVSTDYQLQRENIELKRTLNRLLYNTEDINRLKQENLNYYEQLDTAKRKLQQIKNIL